MPRVGQTFTVAFGILGWGVVLGLPTLGVVPEPEPTAALWIALFVLVILAARALAFRPARLFRPCFHNRRRARRKR